MFVGLPFFGQPHLLPIHSRFDAPRDAPAGWYGLWLAVVKRGGHLAGLPKTVYDAILLAHHPKTDALVR